MRLRKDFLEKRVVHATGDHLCTKGRLSQQAQVSRFGGEGGGGGGEGLVSEQKGLGGHMHRRGVAIQQATNQISKQRSQSEQAKPWQAELLSLLVTAGGARSVPDICMFCNSLQAQTHKGQVDKFATATCLHAAHAVHVCLYAVLP